MSEVDHFRSAERWSTSSAGSANEYDGALKRPAARRCLRTACCLPAAAHL